MPPCPLQHPWSTLPQSSSKETWKVELEAADLEHLAYDWLSEIVFLFETESAVFATFPVKLQAKRRLEAGRRDWRREDRSQEGMPSRTRSRPSPCTSFR